MLSPCATIRGSPLQAISRSIERENRFLKQMSQDSAGKFPAICTTVAFDLVDKSSVSDSPFL
jgi:hypothetical protein